MTINNSLSGASSSLSGASDIRPKLSALIQDLCPHGVEFKKLGEVATLSRGKVYSKEYLRDNAGEYPVYSSQTANNGELGRISTYDYDGKYLTWTTDGAYAGTVFRREGRFSITNVCGLISNVDKALSIDFLYYWLNKVAKGYVYQGMGNPKLMSNVMETIEIPLPPLEIQEKIVECLDKFSALAAELQAELQKRRTQYEYYRTRLLTPPHADSTANSTDDCNWEWKTLGEICEVQDYVANGSFGDIKKNVQYYNEPNYALLVRITDLTNNFQNAQKVYIDEHAYNYMTKSRLDGDEIIISNVGSCGATFLCPKLNVPMSLAPNAILVRTPNNHFYYHWFCSKFGQEAINKIVAKSAMPKFNKTEFRKILLPFPPLAEQQRIADILDKFQSLTTSMEEGIPAEQAAQQKRYEYYRDLLLTFPRKEV